MNILNFLFKDKECDEPSFEEHCENCGELLEDCECDDKWWSSNDISQAYGINEMIFFDEMDED